jgi:hypothetical protein
VKFRINPRGEYLHAELEGRKSAQEMREFLLAVKAACQQHDCPRILLSIRASQPMFKAEDYGLTADTRGEGRGYAMDLVKPGCRVALLGDSSDLHFAHEYIELVARQQQLDVRSFKESANAVRWLQDAAPMAKKSA